MAAGLVDQRQRRRHATGQPLVAEFHQRQHGREQVLALFGQQVLVPARDDTLAREQDAVLHKHGETARKGLARNTQPGLELVETPHAEEGLTHDEECPAVQHNLDGLADRTMPFEPRTGLRPFLAGTAGRLAGG